MVTTVPVGQWPEDVVFDPGSGQLFVADEGSATITILGVTDGNVTKAYSLWQLNHHEIANDRVGRLPVAVTW